MIEKKCIGCGVELQHEDKNGIGYVPEEKFISEENLLCQRCFKIKNYGKNIENPFGKEDYNKVVKDAINGSNIILPIFDIIDFEGSFSEEILDYLRDYRSIVLINKIDLLPGYIHPTEIADWVKLRLEEESIIPDQISFLSTKSKYGINGVIKKINNMFGENKVRAVIFGATNVGKSSLINLLTKNPNLTVSKYAGTTLKVVNNKIPSTNIAIVDTPGLIPEGRLSDLLSAEASLQLVPNNEISRKTFKLDDGQVFMFDELCYFKILNNAADYNAIFSVYSSKDVKFHVTNENRVDELIESNFFTLLSKEESKEYHQLDWVTKKITVAESEELAIAGLGWLNVKRGPLEIELRIPKNVKIVKRKGIFNSSKSK